MSQDPLFGPKSSPEDETTTRAPHFVFVDSVERPEATARLKSAGIPHKRRSLDSSHRNWQDIANQISDPAVVAVLARFTVHHLAFMKPNDPPESSEEVISSPKIAAIMRDWEGKTRVAQVLLSAIAKKNHIIFVHESVMFPQAANEVGESPEEYEYGDYTDRGEFYRMYFGDPDPKNASVVAHLAESYDLHFAPYKTNAELGVLAAIFVNENEQNVIFRLYVPAGQLFKEETGRLLELFHDWLTRIKGKRVRREGYETREGEVYEFFGEEGEFDGGLRGEVDRFAQFLEYCTTSPDQAALTLADSGFDAAEIHQLVTRYAKEARRVQVDAKHSYQQRRLTVRQRLEADLTEAAPSVAVTEQHLSQLLDPYLPEWTSGGQQHVVQSIPRLLEGYSPSVVNIQYNQNVTGNISQQVAQEISGVRLGSEATQLMELISRYAGADEADLRTALYELEDADAKNSNRTMAKARLKAFLSRVGGHVETAAFTVLQKYLETKIGLSGS